MGRNRTQHGRTAALVTGALLVGVAIVALTASGYSPAGNWGPNTKAAPAGNWEPNTSLAVSPGDRDYAVPADFR